LRVYTKYVKAAIFVVLLTFFIILQFIFSIPTNIVMFEGQEHKIAIPFPMKVTEKNVEQNVFNSDNKFLSQNILPEKTGKYDIAFSLLGFNFKNATVNVVKPTEVIPGGTAIGIKLYINGVLVVGLSDIPTGTKTVSPGKKAGLEEGDLITMINGRELKTSGDLSRKVQESGGGDIELTISRKGQTLTKKITPIFYADANEYKIGVWVRDSAAGIGTVTFVNPQDNTFAALGHGISDSDTGVILDIKNGKTTSCKISSVLKGEKGSPGELRGIFDDNDTGQILENREDGIYGYFNNSDKTASTVSIALSSQVHTGEATIYSNIIGDKIEEFKVEIERVMHQSQRGSKGMVVKVTDQRLLDTTGGIVQGMSGSPIMQDGKLVGAVTHVFINDPTRGYGMFAEWMIDSLNDMKNSNELKN